MSDDDYLWSGRGEPGPEIIRLEKALGSLRWSEAKLHLAVTEKPRPRSRARWWVVAAAAVLALVAVSIFSFRRKFDQPLTSWQATMGNQLPQAMRTGQTIETTRDTRGTIESEFVGRVDIEPESRLRLLAARGDNQKMALDYGTIRAFIWAPPTQFVVDTPAAKAVDLGCQYTLQVTKNGNGFLSVELGWVAFQAGDIESFIPAGAACHTRRGHGPDTPYFLDAPKEFVNGLAKFDADGDHLALEQTLTLARPRDAITLWHLLERTQGAQRAEVFDQFSKLVALPPKATRASILRGDASARNEAWNALQLGDTSWWREWKRRW